MPVILKVTPEDEILLAASKMEGKLRKAFLDAVKALKKNVSLKALSAAIKAKDVDKVLAILAVDKKFVGALQGVGLEAGVRSFRDAIQETFAEGAKAGIKTLPKPIAVNLSFNLMNPEAVNFLNSYSFEQIHRISEESREAIRHIVVQAFEDGGHPYEQARRIRNVIGLTANQEKAVANYREALEGGNLRSTLERALRDKRSDRSILAAINTSSALPKARIDFLTERYYEKMLTYRAEMIARTESIRASNHGQLELWRQASAQGLLDETVKREWITSGGMRTCDMCASLSGKTAGLDELFPGGVMTPPRHPHCRCTTGLVFKKRKAA